MSITAEKLSKMGTHGAVFQRIVRDQLSSIDGRLQHHTKTWGRNIVEVELPSVFPSTGLNRKTTQLIIYSQIIRSLKDRGFVVRIAITSECATLFVEWVTDVAPEHIKAMSSVIKKAALDPSDIDDYRRTED